MALSRKKDRTADVSDPAKLLIADHQKVERIFAELKEVDAVAQRSSLAAQLVKELTQHTALEETIVYPFIRENVPDGPSMIDEAAGEHDEARNLMLQLEAIDPGSKAFMDAVAKLKKVVEHHVKDEEKQLFPKMAQAAGEDRLGFLRGDLERAKFAAPDRPLPPDGPTTRRAAAKSRPSSPVSGKPNVWVQPHHLHDDQWQVRREGATRASRVFTTQAEAVDFGRRVAARERVELVIAGRDGAIRQKDTAGR